MKKIYNYTFRAVCIYIVMLIAFVYVTTGFSVETFDRNVLNANVTKELNSVLLSQKQQYVCQVENEKLDGMLEVNTKEEEEEQELIVPSTEEVAPSATPEVTPVPEIKQPSYAYTQTIDTANLPVLATTNGNVSHYGHDCYGCTSGKTATGYDISDGRIYYTDSTYGSVRIVAAGNEYPFGTILRLSNASSSPIIAIVLDRGGAIGQGKKYFLDLLTESEAAANQAGVKYNTTIEVLRMGY